MHPPFVRGEGKQKLMHLHDKLIYFFLRDTMAKHRPLLLVNIILLSPMAASESGEQHYSPSGVWFLSNSSICCHFCCLNQQVTNFFFLAGCRYFTFILFYFFKGLFAENSCPPQLEMMLINAARSADTVKILIPILSIT